MKIVGLTGGIGSGKTTVAKMFMELGVPVYIADIESKKLTNTSTIIKKRLIDLLGEEAYKDGSINREFVSSIIFKDQSLLRKVNSIIHPRVAQHFKNWVKMQEAPYIIKEAAILFESGSYKDCDLVIVVTASKEERLKRVLKRDKVTKEEIERRMDNQWSDAKKEKLADFVIANNQLEETRMHVKSIHESIIN